jgi:multicomponent Na+:H+ antiporter subunit D
MDHILAHLPPLLVALPLLAAPLCVFIRHPIATRAWAVLVCGTATVMSTHLLQRTLLEGVIDYTVSDWAPPEGIALRVDVTNALLAVVVTALATVVLTFGPGSATRTLPDKREYLYYTLYLLCVTGLIGITVTGDAFNVFVFIEITSLSSYALIALGRSRRALIAAFNYLIVGSIGATFYLIGIGLAYQMTGTLNMADMALRLSPILDSRTGISAFAFVAIGLSIKLALFPLHQWLPNAYTFAPSSVSAFMAATATKVSYYVLVRMVYTVFGAGFVFGAMHFDWLLIPAALAAMFVGSTAAIFQTNIKRMLAYSSIAQLGYMSLGLALNNVNGLSSGLMHMVNHALTKGGLFLIVGCISYRLSSARIEDMAGLGRRMPLVGAGFVVGGLGLIGVPGTAGFISKWYLVLGALDKGYWPLAVLILLSSLLAVAYVWRVIEVMYLRPAPAGATTEPTPLSMWLPAWLLIGASVYFGLDTNLTVGIATRAARQLLGTP